MKDLATVFRNNHVRVNKNWLQNVLGIIEFPKFSSVMLCYVYLTVFGSAL